MEHAHSQHSTTDGVSELWNTHIHNIPQQMASEVRQNNDQTMTKTMTGNEMTNDRTMTITMTGSEMTNDGEQNDQRNFSGKYK